MPNIPKPWPKGLEVKDSKYDSLEDELWGYIKYNMQADGHSISTDAINYFLQATFGKEDIQGELRSFMRYLKQDERFIFEGPSRVRMVRVIARSKVEETEGWKDIATKIVNFMLDLTASEGSWRTLELDMSDIFTHFEDFSGDKMLGFSEKAFDFAIVQLILDNRISIQGIESLSITFPNAFDWVNGEYRLMWSAYGFLGYGDKRSSGMRLPIRVWDRIEEITDKLNRDRKQLSGERLMELISRLDQGEGVDFDTLLSNARNAQSLMIDDGYTDNAVLALLIQGHAQIVHFSTTQIVEAAIEIVYAEMERINIADREEFAQRMNLFRNLGSTDMMIDDAEVKSRATIKDEWTEHRF